MGLYFMTRYDDDFDARDAFDPPCSTPDCPACELEIDGIEVTYEPDDPDYGADADGRRGTFQAGSTYVSVAPATCPHCGVALTFDCDREGNVTAYLSEEAE